jgi:cytochrome c oxidase subunit 2
MFRSLSCNEFLAIHLVWTLITLFYNQYINRYLLEGQQIEVIWAVLPAITLVFIALPSLRLLYLLDEVGALHHDLKFLVEKIDWNFS